MSLEKAVEYARSNPITPVGRNSISRFAAILENGVVQIKAWNSYRTHPLQLKFGSNDSCIHLHAEVASIVKAIRWQARQQGRHYDSVTDLSSWKMAVARVLRDGSPAFARPCEGCQRALAAFGITKVEWTV